MDKLKAIFLKYKDKFEHFALGVLAIVCGIIAVYVYQKHGFGWFAAFTATTVGFLYEGQQKYRKEGQVSLYDALATSLPGWLILAWTKIS